jgi:hypothetical protein
LSANASKQHQIKEIIRCGKDPVYFIKKYVRVQHPTKGLIPFDTYPFQDDCLEAFVEHRFNVILKSRQLGISTLAAAYAVWLAYFYKDKNVLIIATKLAVAQNFIKKVKTAIRGLPSWFTLTQMTGSNKQGVEFSNGSQIKAVPTSDDAGRSEALSLLIIDEAAFIRNFDELWMGLYSTLSTGGRAIVLSTPNGVGDKYHELCVGAENKTNKFNLIKLMWDVHPERDDAWFAAETRNMSRKQIAQELMCDFAASGDTFMQAADLEGLAMQVKNPMERWGPELAVWVWKYSLSEHKYIVSADVSRGDGADFSAFHVIDVTASEQVAEFKGKLPPDQFAVLLAEAGKRYNNALICPENNTYGYATIMKLVEQGYKNLYFKSERDKIDALYGMSEPDVSKIGFQTNAKTRGQIMTKLDEVLRNNKVTFRSSRFLDELKTFVWKGAKAQAQKGKNDDLIMAAAIGCWLFDSDPKVNQQSTDLNRAMLAGFAVNSKPFNQEPGPKHVPVRNPGMPQPSGAWMSDFGWVIR